MANGFFRELKHYTLSEVAGDIDATIEQAKNLVGILKKFGIVKAVKASKLEYQDLSNQDIVITDFSENTSDIKIVFDFVGVAIVGNYIFKCYPKYISSTTEPMQHLKKVMKVIKKYNEDKNNKEQQIYLYDGEENDHLFNWLAVSLHLLEDYFQYGIYTSQQAVVEINGEGEILWDKTINETFAFIKNNQPYYLKLQTQNIVNNEMDYFKRLHECILTYCSARLKKLGMLELFDISEVRLTAFEIEDFGEVEYILYRLQGEIQRQFITRKQSLLKTIYAYIANENVNKETMAFSLYGTNSFNLIWEKVCSDNYGSVLDEKLFNLPLGVSNEYAYRRNEKLKKIINRPAWYKNNPSLCDKKVDTLKPDLICIYELDEKNQYCFGIYDAKYYCIDFKYQKDSYRVTGQPGVEDVTKQYLYQLAYDDFIRKQGYQYVQNLFLCPQEEADPNYGYVEMEMLHTIGNKILGNIAVVKLCAEEMYDLYLTSKSGPGKGVADYPSVGRRTVYGNNFTFRMMEYLQKFVKVSQRSDSGIEMNSEWGNFIYPKCIKREVGAKLVYDAICLVAVSVLYGFDPYEKDYGINVAEDMGKSFEKCEQFAEVALEVEEHIKEMSEEKLKDKRIIKFMLRQCLESREKISIMASGNSMDRLVEKIMELIQEIYL